YRDGRLRHVSVGVSGMRRPGGTIVQFPIKRRHARASVGAGSEARTSKVISVFRFRRASATSSRQREAGMPLSRQVETVEGGQLSAAATPPVPPSSFRMPSTVAMGPLIVRRLRTSQEFADRETTFPDSHVPIEGMIDPPEIIAPRLKRLRRACGF